MISEDKRAARLAPIRARWANRARAFAPTEWDAAILGRAEIPHVLATWCPAGVGCRCLLCGPARQRRYALSRVAGLDRKIRDRMIGCGVNEIPLACACGPLVGVERCRQIWVCNVCQELRAEKQRRRLGDGLRAALRSEIDTWAQRGARGVRPHIRLLTFTTKHSGDLRRDREHLEQGWRALYKRMHREWGRYPYAGVWEVTRGRDGLGHVHAHVAVIWGYRDYDDVREMFAAGCSDAHLDIRPPRVDGKPSTGASAAKYLAKYMSKGVQGDEFSPELRAEVVSAMYNVHAVFASTRFWVRCERVCKTCRQRVKRMITVDGACYDRWRIHGPPMYQVDGRWQAGAMYYVQRRFDPSTIAILGKLHVYSEAEEAIARALRDACAVSPPRASVAPWQQPTMLL